LTSLEDQVTKESKSWRPRMSWFGGTSEATQAVTRKKEAIQAKVLEIEDLELQQATLFKEAAKLRNEAETRLVQGKQSAAEHLARGDKLDKQAQALRVDIDVLEKKAKSAEEDDRKTQQDLYDGLNQDLKITDGEIERRNVEIARLEEEAKEAKEQAKKIGTG